MNFLCHNLNDNSCKMIVLIVILSLLNVYVSGAIQRNSTVNSLMKDENHGIKMGEIFEGCDDAEV